MKNKRKLFIIFSDIDNTFEPISMATQAKLLQLVKEIRQKEQVEVKLSLISGRQAVYVKGLLNHLQSNFRFEGVENFADCGAGEQGALYVGGNSPEQLEFIGSKADEKIAHHIKLHITTLLNQSPLSNMIVESKQNEYMNSFFIQPKLLSKLSAAQRHQIFEQATDLLKDKFEDKINISFVGECLEVTPKCIGKDKAIQYILDKYSKEYDIVGMTYSGDSANDLSACRYASNLGAFHALSSNLFHYGQNNVKNYDLYIPVAPPFRSNVLIPGNAISELSSAFIEGWHKRIPSEPMEKSVNRSLNTYFEGVIALLSEKLQQNKLVTKTTSHDSTHHICHRRANDDFFATNYDNHPESATMQKLRMLCKKAEDKSVHFHRSNF